MMKVFLGNIPIYLMIIVIISCNNKKTEKIFNISPIENDCDTFFVESKVKQMYKIDNVKALQLSSVIQVNGRTIFIESVYSAYTTRKEYVKIKYDQDNTWAELYKLEPPEYIGYLKDISIDCPYLSFKVTHGFENMYSLISRYKHYRYNFLNGMLESSTNLNDFQWSLLCNKFKEN